MKNVMTSILTDASVRDNAAVQQALVSEAEKGGPWASVAEQ